MVGLAPSYLEIKGGNVMGFPSIYPMTFGVAKKLRERFVHALLLLCSLGWSEQRKWHRDSLRLVGSLHCWAECLDKGSCISDSFWFFFICELVFWLVIRLLWVVTLGRNCAFRSGYEWCNSSAPGPCFFCLLCCPDGCGVCYKPSSACPVFGPWWAVLCEFWALPK